MACMQLNLLMWAQKLFHTDHPYCQIGICRRPLLLLARTSTFLSLSSQKMNHFETEKLAIDAMVRGI